MASDGSGGPKTGKNRKAGGGGGGGGGGGSATAETRTQRALNRSNETGETVRGRRTVASGLGQRQGRANAMVQVAMMGGRTQGAERRLRATLASQRGGSSSGGSRSPRRTAPQTKKTQSSTEQRYRRMTSNLRRERREGRSGRFQAERLDRFTGSRGRD